MASFFGVYDLLDIGIAGGFPVNAIRQPNLFPLLSDDINRPATLTFGQDKNDLKSALLMRFDLKSDLSSVIPNPGQIITGATIRVIAKDINTNPLLIDIGILKPDGFWSPVDGVYLGSASASGMDCANFKLRNASATLLSTPVYVPDAGIPRDYPLNQVLIFQAHHYGQCILNNTGAGITPFFVDFDMFTVGSPVPTGTMVCKVFKTISNDGSDDRAIGPALITSDPVDIATVLPTAGVRTVVTFPFITNIPLTHPNNERRCYLIEVQGAIQAFRHVTIALNNLAVGGTSDIGSAVMNDENSGFAGGFMSGSYHSGYDVQHMHDQAGAFIGGTTKTTFPPKLWDNPHSARAEAVPVETFPIVDDAHVIGLLNEIDPLVQKWIDDPRYPYSPFGDKEPIGFIFSIPSSALTEQERTIASALNSDIKLTLFFEDLVVTIGCPEFEGAIDANVDIQTKIDPVVVIKTTLSQSIEMKTSITPRVSMLSSIEPIVSMNTELC